MSQLASARWSLPCLVALLGLTQVASAQAPPVSQVSIKAITYGGTGCPQGTAGRSLSDDRKTLTLLFDQYVASVGPTVPITESRKSCQLSIELAIPSGYSYAVSTVSYRGNVQLPPKATASAQTTVYFPAAAKQATARISITGPAARDYVETQTIAAPSLAWSACNRTESLGVKSDVRIMAPPADQAKMAPDSIDGKVQLILGLQFRRC